MSGFYRLWDGKEDLGVGMELTVLNTFDTPLVVKQIINIDCDEDDQYLLAEVVNNKHHLVWKHQLRSLVIDPKVKFAKKMLEVIRESHPDFAHDTSWDIRELAMLCYEDLMEGGE
tara:strand:+ start:5713 stop:6057 length:345 start_codon:yes stop_codon:yes gene_type:complete